MAADLLNDAVPLPADGIAARDTRRGLVIMLRHHGDVLLTTPVFSALRAAAPEAELDALIYSETRDMLALHPDIARIHLIERAWSRLGPVERLRREARLFRELRARQYDLIVHLSENPRGAFLARVLRPRTAVARRIGGRGRFWHGSFTHCYHWPRGTPRHTVERNLDALRRLGIQPPAEARRLVLLPGAEAEASVDQRLSAAGLHTGGFIHLHPVSRWKFKCLPVVRNAELIDRLAAAGWPVVVTGAPQEEELDFVRQILRASTTRPVDLAGQLTLKETAALSARAALFVGVDSAPMHIAAAMGTPVVALFGPSSDIEWGPWMVPHRVVASERHPCRPCRIDGCGGGKVSDCLVSLEAQRVVQACSELLSGRQPAPLPA